MFGQDFIQRAIIWGPVILFSLTVHEFFHAWTANKFGDDTAKRHGRLTLNPLAHLDLFGTIVMVASGFRFGWAKPVPVDPRNLRNPRVANLWISAAGPLSNIGMALIAGMWFRLVGDAMGAESPVTNMLVAAVIINITLAVFNMIPLFPLDGSHVLSSLLPPQQAIAFQSFNRFAPYILLIVIVTGVFWRVIGPVVVMFSQLILGY
ncbi:MAG: site-2 protease family protein [Candidatus Zixiibacteriota bacterium]|nr:MAG: site-2 protease family protein [candidate division Zixibacteria bacterium]